MDKFSTLKLKSIRHFRNAPRAAVTLSLFLGFVFLLAGATGCAPNASQQGGGGAESGNLPELTDDIIRERINYAAIWDVPEENGTGEPISWRFVEEEPKEIVVVEKQMAGERATIVLDIKTRTGPNRRNPRALAGQIRTEWELKTGWALRRWEIVDTKNISMKYKNLPKPPAQNSNR